MHSNFSPQRIPEGPAAKIQDLLRVVAQTELSCEQKRLELSDCPDFSSRLFYEHICADPNSGLTPADVLHFFRAHRYDADFEHLEAFVAAHDLDSDNALSFDEWQSFLSCRSIGYADTGRLDISTDVVDMFVSLVDEEITAALTINKALRLLRSKCTYGELHQAFEQFDQNHKGYLDLKDIYEGLTSQGEFMITHSMAGRVVRRFDRDFDKKISFPEWVRFFGIASGYSESKQLSPQRDNMVKSHKDVVTVIESSPERTEKRVYVIHRTEDGQIQFLFTP